MDGITVYLSYTFNETLSKMAKTGKKDEKKLLLRLPKKAYEAVKRSAEVNKRSINSELEYSIEEKYL